MSAEMEMSEMKEQRDVALACLVLAVAISISVFLTVFRNQTADFAAVEESVAVHRKLLQDNEAVLQENQKVLDALNAELARRHAAATTQ